MGAAFAGIDIDAAASLVSTWRVTAARVGDTVCRASMRGDDLFLDAGSVSRQGELVAEGLRAAADLLDARAAALTEVPWGSVTSGSGVADVRRDHGEAEREALLAWLRGGARGSLVSDVADPSEAAWAELVAAGSIVDGGRTKRYLDIARDPGGGVIVIDFFIPDATSFVVQGDGRGHRDPVFGDLDEGDSRMILVFDLEAGRASVQLDDTCLAGGLVCNEARPIELAGSEVVWLAETGDDVLVGVPTPPTQLVEIPNQVSVTAEPGRVEIDYDVLNGVIPLGSVDGTITLTAAGTDRYRVSDLDTDAYPSIGVYQYRDVERVEVLARQDSIGIHGVFPWVPAVVDATGRVVDRGIDAAGDLADDIGAMIGGSDVGELIEQYCADHPEEDACE